MADKQTLQYLKEAAALRAKAKKDLEDQTKELMKQKGLSEAAARLEAKKLPIYKQTVAELKEIVSQVEEVKRKQKEGIESLKWMDPAAITELIKNEHPQIIATILVHLERDLSAAVLNLFMERLRSDVILRIATLEGIQPNALMELNDVLSKALSGGEKLQKTTLGGVRAAAEILNFVGATSENLVLDDIRAFDNELSQKIQDEMFLQRNVNGVVTRGVKCALLRRRA